MMPVEDIVLIDLVALLALFLYLRFRQRMAKERDRREVAGRPIDVSQLKGKLEQVRRNHLATRGPAKGICFHRAALATFRRTVAGLAYFRAREPEPLERK